MWLKKVKRKKMQLFLVGLVLFVTSAILAMCLCFTMELSTFAKNFLNEGNCPDVFVASIGSTDLERNIKDKTVKDNIEKASSLTGKTVSVPVTYKGDSITQFYVMALSAENYKNWGYMKLSDGDVSETSPGKGEVWISKTLALPVGIKIGDTIILDYDRPLELKVSAFYTATFAPTSSNAFSPLMISDKDLSKIENEADVAFIAVDLINASNESIDKLLDSDSYLALSVSRDALVTTFTSESNTVGGIGALAAMVIFIVALAIIRFIIKNNLLKELRTIGIYKSLGYPTHKIKGFYLKGYMLIGSVSIIAGALIALPMAYKLGVISSGYVENFTLTGTSYSVCVAVILLLMGLLFLNVQMALKRVKKITPVKAIADGLNSTEQKLTYSVIKNAKSPIAMAINEMFKYKRTSVMMLLVMTVSIYLAMLFTNVCYSSFMMTENSNLWFAVPKNNTFVSGIVDDRVCKWIKKSKYVDSMVYGTLYYRTSVTSTQYDGNLKDVTFDIFSDTSEDLTKVPISDGIPPEETDEIAVTKKLLDRLNMKVGDYLILTINDETNEYHICGTYSSMMSNYGIMLTVEAMEQCNPDYVSSMCFINLKDKGDFTQFKKELEDNFSCVSVDKEWFLVENSIKSIKSMLVSVSIIFIIVFIIFSILNIVIVLLMDNNNKRRQNGILKSLGFTSVYIMKKYLCKFIILSCVSATAALTLHLAFSGKVLAAIVIDAFADSYPLLEGLIFGFIGLIVLTTFLISLQIRKISPVELMEE